MHAFIVLFTRLVLLPRKLQDVPNDDLKAESEVLPAKEVAVDGHTKSD